MHCLLTGNVAATPNAGRGWRAGGEPFPGKDLRAAQAEFRAEKRVGNFVIVLGWRNVDRPSMMRNTGITAAAIGIGGERP